jgi:hypothetical protein
MIADKHFIKCIKVELVSLGVLYTKFTRICPLAQGFRI